MFLGWMWLTWLVSHAWANVSNVSDTTAVFSYNDKCSNQCNDNDKTQWCRNRRIDQQGVISRCVEYTRYGRTCITKCFESPEKHRWCKTNPIKTQSAELWDYCSLEGLTINGQECVDACEKRDEDYYYCHTSSSWDYCSPPGRVKPLQLTVRGAQCKGECHKTAEDYTWCSKNDYCKKCTDWWDYCSLDSTRTRKGAQCKDSCSKRGEDYYWCRTAAGWDYCSPKAEDGVHISLNVQFDIYGHECLYLCSTYGEKYFYCTSSSGTWQYCSTAGKTIYNSDCTDSCSRKGEDYHWCHTASSWDYCSPTEYTAGAPGAMAQISILILAMGISARQYARNI